MTEQTRKKHHGPISHIKRLPRTGLILGTRFAMLLRLPIFLLLTFIVHTGIFFCAWIFYLLEAEYNPKLLSFLDALYWAVTTITTVGFGDIVPVTDSGKVLAMITMIFGTLCIVLYTAFFAGALIAPELAVVESQVKDMERVVKDFSREMRSDEHAQIELIRRLEDLIKKNNTSV